MKPIHSLCDFSNFPANGPAPSRYAGARVVMYCSGKKRSPKTTWLVQRLHTQNKQTDLPPTCTAEQLKQNEDPRGQTARKVHIMQQPGHSFGHGFAMFAEKAVQCNKQTKKR
eukprot:GDKI01033781.1.p1 GENE.GDKI01033781.1~~GDKI01033781.1.p1  ORF type:complete len:127 (-),score=18.21 GDKI01033781.1:51-386(-)